MRRERYLKRRHGLATAKRWFVPDSQIVMEGRTGESAAAAVMDVAVVALVVVVLFADEFDDGRVAVAEVAIHRLSGRKGQGLEDRRRIWHIVDTVRSGWNCIAVARTAFAQDAADLEEYFADSAEDTARYKEVDNSLPIHIHPTDDPNDYLRNTLAAMEKRS